MIEKECDCPVCRYSSWRESMGNCKHVHLAKLRSEVDALMEEKKMIDKAKLAEWKAKTDAATEGPWSISITIHPGDYDGEYAGGIAYVPEVLTVEDSEGAWMNIADTEFIAVAREAVPALLAEVERLQGLVDSYQGVEKAEHTWSPRCASGECDICRAEDDWRKA